MELKKNKKYKSRNRWLWDR